jgi:mannose/cellobiose epimerase-like protein (N-acyl-D-glucosamine 2-epimerase family)
MARNTTKSNCQSQSDKFKEAAREHEADEDEGRWEKRLRKVAKKQPSSDPK